MSKTSTMKKAVALLAAALLTVMCACALVGCGPNSEELIRNSISEEFDAYKNLDDAKLSEIADKAEEEGLDELGINGTEFATAILDGFDYNIDSVVVNDKTATAELTIVSKSYSGFESQLEAVVDELKDDPSFADMTTEEMQNALGERVMAAFDNVETVTENVTLNYQLNADGNIWEPVNATEALSKLDSVIFAS